MDGYGLIFSLEFIFTVKFIESTKYSLSEFSGCYTQFDLISFTAYKHIYF